MTGRPLVLVLAHVAGAVMHEVTRRGVGSGITAADLALLSVRCPGFGRWRRRAAMGGAAHQAIRPPARRPSFRGSADLGGGGRPASRPMKTVQGRRAAGGTVRIAPLRRGICSIEDRQSARLYTLPRSTRRTRHGPHQPPPRVRFAPPTWARALSARDPLSSPTAPRLRASSRVAPACQPSFDDTADRIARLQHGVVTRRQLLEAGIAGGVIDRRLTSGRLKPLFRGVYLVGPLTPPIAREMAACLACGPTAVASHDTAAALWGMIEGSPTREVHVSVQKGNPRRRGIVTHRPKTLRSDETTTRKHVPITTPARTILDLARSAHSRVVRRAISNAVTSRLMTPAAASGLASLIAGRPGGPLLREVLGEHGPLFTRSEAEVRFLDLIEQAGLPVPQVNSRVAGYEVDFHWPEAGLVVEVDGFAYHSSPRDFEQDRIRDGDLTGAGLRVIRVTWRQLTTAPLAVAARLGACLAPSLGRVRRGDRASVARTGTTHPTPE